MQMQRHAVAGRGFCNCCERSRADGSQAVRADRDRHVVSAGLANADIVREKFVDRQREKHLAALWRRFLESGALVQDGNVGEANTAVGCGAAQGIEHLRARLCRSGCAIQVVEFGNRRVADREHFRIGLTRDRIQRLCVDSLRKRVHAFPPGPEIVFTCRRALLRMAGQCPLESVAVRVGQARDNPAQRDIGTLCNGAGRNRREPSAFDVEADIVGPAVRQ